MLKQAFPAALAALFCLLAGCTAPAQPTPIPEPTPTAEVTVTAAPRELLSPCRIEERFSSGIDTWGTRQLFMEYEDEYGPLYYVDVTLPWTTVEGEGYAAINKRFEELMEEYKGMRIYGGSSPLVRIFQKPKRQIDVYHPDFTPSEVGQLVSFRFFEDTYYGKDLRGCPTWAETYDVTTGDRLGFEDFFSDPEEAEARIQAEILRQAEADPEAYADVLAVYRNNPKSISNFSRASVYPVEDGFAVFFGWYSFDHGDQVRYAPTFLIPWEVLAGVTNPIFSSPGPEYPEDPSILLQKSGKFYGREGQLVYEYDISLPFFSVSQGPYVSVSRYYQEWIEELAAKAEESAQGSLDMAEDFPELSVYTPAYLSIHAGLTFCDGEGLLQVCGTEESYGLGAAHPLHTAFSHTFDQFTGERIELPDLFTNWEQAREVLWTAIEPQAREALAFPDIRTEQLAGRLELAKELLEQDSVFFLNEKGLTIHYNEYAVASYVEGDFDFFAPKENLSGLTAYPIWD